LAVGGGSTTELRTRPVLLGTGGGLTVGTFELTPDGSVSVGTEDDGVPMLSSVVTVPRDPQFVHGVLDAAGLA
jgi:hypothetical protein